MQGCRERAVPGYGNVASTLETASTSRLPSIGYSGKRRHRSTSERALAQCAAGERQKTKIPELNVETWKKQMDWLVDPSKAFAFPHILDDDVDKWRYMAVQGGIPFDRVRLLRLVSDEDLDSTLLSRVDGWLQARLAIVKSLDA